MPSIEFRLKEILAERNMTQLQLSKLTGIREAAISALANNQYERVQLSHIARIMETLDIADMNEIMRYKK